MVPIIQKWPFFEVGNLKAVSKSMCQIASTVYILMPLRLLKVTHRSYFCCFYAVLLKR